MMKYKQNRKGIEKCIRCGEDTDKVAISCGCIVEPMCQKCYEKEKYRKSDMTEADYQTWGRL